MSDNRTDEQPAEFIDTAGAPMLQTLGQATKTPGRCACGEHADVENPTEDHDHA
ncbi:MAG: hypothetical protein WD250_04740 [Egibacteraceae bacterium]